MISVAKENFRAARAAAAEMGGAAENVAEFRLENPVDPTTSVVAPYVEEDEQDRAEASCGLGANVVDDSGVLPLSRMQLDRIEAAKARAAERAAADANADEPALPAPMSPPLPIVPRLPQRVLTDLRETP